MPTPERTSLAEIITAGREILEAEGPDGLTMKAVAIRVGVRAPSLYKRVRGRDALLSAVADATIAELAERLDAAGRNLPALASEFRAYAHEHPEGFRLMYSIAGSEEALRWNCTEVYRRAAGRWEIIQTHWSFTRGARS